MGLGFFSTVPGFFWHVLGMRDLGWIFSFVSGFFVVDVSCGFHFDRGVQLVCRSCVQTLRLCVCVCVTVWCMLQAGVSNHVVGILDDRASVALPGP